MDYEEKKFYDFMEEKKWEIISLDIPHYEKNILYQLLDKSIQQYEESKVHLETNLRLIKALDKMGKGLQELISTDTIIKKGLHDLEKTAMRLKISKALESQKPFNN